MEEDKGKNKFLSGFQGIRDALTTARANIRKSFAYKTQKLKETKDKFVSGVEAFVAPVTQRVSGEVAKVKEYFDDKDANMDDEVLRPKWEGIWHKMSEMYYQPSAEHPVCKPHTSYEMKPLSDKQCREIRQRMAYGESTDKKLLHGLEHGEAFVVDLGHSKKVGVFIGHNEFLNFEHRGDDASHVLYGFGKFIKGIRGENPFESTVKYIGLNCSPMSYELENGDETIKRAGLLFEVEFKELNDAKAARSVFKFTTKKENIKARRGAVGECEGLLPPFKDDEKPILPAEKVSIIRSANKVEFDASRAYLIRSKRVTQNKINRTVDPAEVERLQQEDSLNDLRLLDLDARKKSSQDNFDDYIEYKRYIQDFFPGSEVVVENVVAQNAERGR
ncbi:MAG: hypothetical protein GY804_06375 [Alphaproteobacteria bacterium]|nr:hypothetical protein [Alphaproteobacteria bacterium]